MKKDYLKIVDFLIGFRQYILYHLHAVKTYLHTRMRKKVTQFVKTINEAKRDQDDSGKKYKELIGGSTLNTTEEEKKQAPSSVYKYKTTS